MADEANWGQILRAWRAREGWTQTQLGLRLDVDQTTVSRWERRLDMPGIAQRRRIRDLMRRGDSHTQDAIVRARVRNALWPKSLVSRGAVYVEFNAAARAEIGLGDKDLRGQSIYGAFGQQTDAVTHTWEESGIFGREIALTIAVNRIEHDGEPPFYIRTMDSPHVTADGDVWCLCEIKRINASEYERLRTEYGGPMLVVPVDTLA